MRPDHADRITKYFSPLGGECVCEFCVNLPWHEGQPVPSGPFTQPRTVPADPTPTDAELEARARREILNAVNGLSSGDVSFANAERIEKAWDTYDRAISATARRAAFAEAVALVEGMPQTDFGFVIDNKAHWSDDDDAISRKDAVAALRRLAEWTP